MFKKKRFKFRVMDINTGEVVNYWAMARTLIGAKSQFNFDSYVTLSITIMEGF